MIIGKKVILKSLEKNDKKANNYVNSNENKVLVKYG